MVESLEDDVTSIVMYPPMVEMVAAILRQVHSDSDDEK